MRYSKESEQCKDRYAATAPSPWSLISEIMPEYPMLALTVFFKYQEREHHALFVDEQKKCGILNLGRS